MATTKSLSKFIESVNDEGGFSLSNNFDVEFSLPTNLQNYMKDYGVDFTSTGGTGGLLKLLCDEAQLPNIQAATGQTTGRYLGEGLVNYPHTKIYNDFQLGWMGDSNLLSLKFLNLWYGYIFQDYVGNSGTVSKAQKTAKNSSLTEIKNVASSQSSVGRSVRLNYPTEYLASITITKTDRAAKAANGRAPISYTMIDAYPYSIDAVPLSYGASQIVKVTANFYYAKHVVTYNQLTKPQNDKQINGNDAGNGT